MLEAAGTTVAEERSSRREPFTDADVRRLLAGVETVLVAQGKRVRRLPAADAGLDDLKGPSGNYRAPMLRRGSTLVVGFHAGALEELVG